MATARAILNQKYLSKDGTYPIVIRLINGKDQKLHPTGWKVAEKYWNEETEGVIKKHPDHDVINGEIDELLSRARRYFSECRQKDLPIDLSLVYSETGSHSFTGYLKHREQQHREAGQIEMQKKVSRYIKEFTFCFGRELYFSEITQDLLREFDLWLMKADDTIGKEANSPNTRYKKMEFLGKYFGNAMDEKKAHGPNPFKVYKKTIKQTQVRKEKLTRPELTAIEDLPLKGLTELARDMFLFSYYCKGIRFEIVLTMKKFCIQNGRLYYLTNKGEKPQSTLIHPKLQSIIDKYIHNPTDTIFGRCEKVGDLSPESYRSKIGSENALINKQLKIVSDLAGVRFPLSFHASRHSFAYHLKQVSDNIHVIKDALNHSKTSTTELYLKALDDEHLDLEVGKLYQ